MKKSSLLIMIACAGFLLSSCSQLSNISVTKRHYRSGYHVDFGSSKQHIANQQASETITAAATPAASDKLKEKADVSPEKTTPEPSPVFIAGNTPEKKQAQKKANDNVNTSKRNIATIKKEIQGDKTSLDKSSITSESDSNDETPQWLLICFSILLPPLAIALKFGIETKFWISILLTLLFWIPGVIYALYWILK